MTIKITGKRNKSSDEPMERSRAQELVRAFTSAAFEDGEKEANCCTLAAQRLGELLVDVLCGTSATEVHAHMLADLIGRSDEKAKVKR